jgi:hypothetical protein
MQDPECRSRRPRSLRFVILAGVVALAMPGCSLLPPPAPSRAATAPTPPSERLPIDPQVSPVSFQWLAADAILVKPETTTRTLAALGNAIARAAESRPSVRLSVYDDAEGWQADEAEPARVVPRRAEYEKRSEGDPIERFVVFDKDGGTLYERDFRDYPLGPTDAPVDPIP